MTRGRCTTSYRPLIRPHTCELAPPIAIPIIVDVIAEAITDSPAAAAVNSFPTVFLTPIIGIL